MLPMSGPKPGQIRCPTCHRSTPAIENCTRCGSPIPPGARTRPRGLDREELQARIRARRSGQTYRRGSVAGDYAAAAPAPPADVEPGPPEPWTDDAWAEYQNREGAAAASAPAYDQGEQPPGPAWDEPPQPRWQPEQVGEPPRQPARYVDDPTVRGPAYGPASDAAYGEQPSWEPLPYDQTAATDVRYRVRDDQDERRRGSGGGIFMVLGFLGLGALALFAGTVLFTMFAGDDGDNLAAVPSAAATQSIAPTSIPSAAASASQPPAGSDEPAASATPASTTSTGRVTVSRKSGE